MDFSTRLKELRKERNVSQAEVAKQTGLSCGCIGMLETVKREPTGNTLVALASYFEVSVDYLLGIEDDFGNIVVSESNEITPEEKELLTLFRSLPNIRRKTVMDSIRFMTEPSDTADKKFKG